MAPGSRILFTLFCRTFFFFLIKKIERFQIRIQTLGLFSWNQKNWQESTRAELYLPISAEYTLFLLGSHTLPVCLLWAFKLVTLPGLGSYHFKWAIDRKFYPNFTLIQLRSFTSFNPPLSIIGLCPYLAIRRLPSFLTYILVLTAV